MKEYLKTRFAQVDEAHGMAITVVSFGFKYGIPLDADMVWDVRFLPNPFYIPEFELKMAWCPLLHHHPAHRWLRQLILYVARQMIEEENREFLMNNSQFSHY